jgi:hypothetical protein
MRTGGTLLVLAAVGGGCSTIQTRWECDPSADCSAFRAYQWVDVRGAVRTEAIANRVREATERVLVAQGFSADGAAPAFSIVVYFDPEPGPPLSEDAYRQPTELGVSVGYVLGEVFHGDGTPSYRLWARPNDYASESQTLRIEFVDPMTQRVIWRGCAKGPFDARMSAEKQAKLVDRAVARLLARFPRAH